MTQNTGVSVCVCGNVVFDVLVRPVEELKWAATTLVETVSQQLGGNGGTTAYAIGKLGVPVFLVTLVGRDAAGETALARLRSAGVDTSRAFTTKAATSVAICIVNRAGERALLYQLGAAAEEFPSFPIGGAKHFHLAAVYRMPHLRRAAPEVLRRAKELGMVTSVDTQWDTEGEWMKALAPSLPMTDLLFVNEDEARMLTGHADARAAAGTLRSAGAERVCVKLGARGCLVASERDEFISPGFAVEAIDSTGAGDSFCGGYIAALERGLEHREAAQAANAAGALSVGMLGATSGLLGWEEMREWMKDRQTVKNGSY
jgi:sugar/nucleoside kinase (ribokinase family)